MLAASKAGEITSPRVGSRTERPRTAALEHGTHRSSFEGLRLLWHDRCASRPPAAEWRCPAGPSARHEMTESPCCRHRARPLGHDAPVPPLSARPAFRLPPLAQAIFPPHLRPDASARRPHADLSGPTERDHGRNSRLRRLPLGKRSPSGQRAAVIWQISFITSSLKPALTSTVLGAMNP